MHDRNNHYTKKCNRKKKHWMIRRYSIYYFQFKRIKKTKKTLKIFLTCSSSSITIVCVCMSLIEESIDHSSWISSCVAFRRGILGVIPPSRRKAAGWELGGETGRSSSVGLRTGMRNAMPLDAGSGKWSKEEDAC